MDRITRSFIQEMLSLQEMESESESKDFEKLVNYTVISNYYNRSFDLDYVTVGEGNDTGIDGLGIIVNGQMIETTDEIDDLIDKNGSLEVTFIFTQAKTSASFNSGEINTFIFGIKDFFTEDPSLVRNEDIKKFAELSDFLYSKAATFKANPDIKLFFVTTGNWTHDQNLSAVINYGKNELEQKNLFNKVTFEPYGAKELAAAYRKTKEAISCTITLENKITIPSIKGVSEAYIGLLRFSEFTNIIVDEDDKLLSVFEDNVRDFQGDTNDVNKVINNTVKGESNDLFGVLNNGVTIVASTISSTGDSYQLTDYQIVNGCQTSNVLFNNRHNDNINNVRVPVKMIATTNEEVKNQITLATNNQTPIKKEQFAALTDFQRRLEQYYKSFEGDGLLYYERRSKQYNTDTSFTKTRIISIPIQIKSFSAMFLQNPHIVTSYFGTIVKKLNSDSSQIFNHDHSFIPYYTSALAYYRLESLFRRQKLQSRYKRVRFHLITLFKILAKSEAHPQMNSERLMNKYCEPIITILNDEDKYLPLFQQAIDAVDNADFDLDDKQHVKQAPKTQLLIDFISSKHKAHK